MYFCNLFYSILYSITDSFLLLGTSQAFQETCGGEYCSLLEWMFWSDSKNWELICSVYTLLFTQKLLYSILNSYYQYYIEIELLLCIVVYSLLHFEKIHIIHKVILIVLLSLRKIFRWVSVGNLFQRRSVSSIPSAPWLSRTSHGLSTSCPGFLIFAFRKGFLCKLNSL